MITFPKAFVGLICIFIAWSSLGLAQGLSKQEFRNVEVYFEAGMFDNAQQILEELLSKDPPAWQAGILQYDFGCIYLAQGDLDKAIRTFSSLQNIAGLSPILIQKLNLNLGIAHYRKAAILYAVQVKERDYPRIIYHLKQSILGFGLALKAECFIEEKVGGYETCQASSEILKLQTSAKVLLAEVLDQAQQIKLENITLKQGIPWLFFGMGGIIADINFLQNSKMGDSLKTNYQALFANNASDWLPVWSQVSERTSTISDEDSKQKSIELFDEAKGHFEKMIDYLKNGKLDQSKDAAEETIKHLENLMQLAFGEDPLFVLLQNLQSQFTSVLNNEDLRESSWINLRNQFISIENIKANLKEVRESIDKSKQAFNTGYESFKEAKYAQAKLFLHGAAFWIQDAILKLDKQLPVKILAGVLEEQNLALRLNQLRFQLAETDITDAIKKAWVESQQAVLQNTKPFLQAVYDAQIKIFRGEGTQRCQSSPWNEVLPLYEQGLLAAKEASIMLQGRFAQQQQAIIRQESAVAAWKQALNLLLNPPPYQEGSCFGGGGQAKQQQQEPKDQEETPQPKETSNEKVLQLLQEMDLDDKLPSTEQAPIQKGLKPW